MTSIPSTQRAEEERARSVRVTSADGPAPLVRRWKVSVYGFEWHIREAETAAKAKYADFKAAREAGYFTGRDGFWRYLTQVTVTEWPA